MSHKPNRDQAEGLRRILAEKCTRQLCFLSAVSAPQKNAVLLNLAAALVRAGNAVQLLDASLSAQGIASRAAPALTRTLWDVAQHGTGLEDAVRAHDPGVALSRLSTQALGLLQSQPAELDKLSQVLRELSPDANFWLLDCDLQTDNPFVLPELSASEVVVLVSNTPTSIKSAYTEMKEFQARFGRRQYQLLVLDASALQAQTIGKNMALAVNRYLASQLLALGNVPPDAHWSRAVQLGRAIVDAFPKAPAAVAFREITARLVSAQADAPHPARAQARPTATLEI